MVDVQVLKSVKDLHKLNEKELQVVCGISNRTDGDLFNAANTLSKFKRNPEGIDADVIEFIQEMLEV